MSQIESVLKKLEGTSVYDILINVENAYERISREQGEWYDKTHFFCLVHKLFKKLKHARIITCLHIYLLSHKPTSSFILRRSIHA